MKTEETPIFVVLADGFEEIEFTAPVDILRRLGVNILLGGLNNRQVTGAHGIVVQADCLLSEVSLSGVRGILIPGGPASWVLKDAPEVLSAVREMVEAGKWVAAICAAPMVLAAAGILQGRRVTCYPDPEVQRAVRDAGAELSSAQAEVDGKLITGRGPGAALDFGYALGSCLVGAQAIPSLQQGMCFIPHEA